MTQTHITPELTAREVIWSTLGFSFTYILAPLVLSWFFVLAVGTMTPIVSGKRLLREDGYAIGTLSFLFLILFRLWIK